MIRMLTFCDEYHKLQRFYGIIGAPNSYLILGNCWAGRVLLDTDLFSDYRP